MLNAIKAFLSTKMTLVLIIVGSILIASLGTMTVLYKLKVKDYQIQAGTVKEITQERDTLKTDLSNLNLQIADERKRHEKLVADMKQTYDEFSKKQQDLIKKKNDVIIKELAKKDPKNYEKQAQELLNNYTNRMNCISGNKSACSRI